MSPISLANIQLAQPETLSQNIGLRSKVYHQINRVATRKDFFSMNKSKLFEVFLTSRRRVRHGGAEQLFVNRRCCLAERRSGSPLLLPSTVGCKQLLSTLSSRNYYLTSAENISFCHLTSNLNYSH